MYAQVESRGVCKRLPQAFARILTSLQAKKSSLLHIQGPMIDFTSFAAPCKRQNYVHTFWVSLFRYGYFLNQLVKSFEIWDGET